MSNKATAGGAADDEVSLKTRPQMVGFRGIGTTSQQASFVENV